MLDTGIGKVLKLWRLFFGFYLYVEDKNGRNPLRNEGCIVTAKEANKMSIKASKVLTKYHCRTDLLTRFSEFCEQSGGFKIT